MMQQIEAQNDTDANGNPTGGAGPLGRGIGRTEPNAARTAAREKREVEGTHVP